MNGRQSGFVPGYDQVNCGQNGAFCMNDYRRQNDTREQMMNSSTMSRNFTINSIRAGISGHLSGMAPLLTMVLWGSMYVANRMIMESIPAMVLLFVRFAISGALLLGVAKMQGLPMIRKEDLPDLLQAAVPGYFLCEGALLLSTQYSNAGFASLLNAMSPVTISIFAVLFLGEKLSRRECAALGVAVLGAIVIIGNPGEGITFAGIFFALLSLVTWSYITTVPIRRLTARYNPIVVTGSAMALAAVPAIPASATWMRVTGETMHLSGDLVLPVLYVSVVCTAGAHFLWNWAMSKGAATSCAAFYPFQPLTSMVLGVLLLGESCSLSFLTGAALILFSILMRQSGDTHSRHHWSLHRHVRTVHAG